MSFIFKLFKEKVKNPIPRLKINLNEKLTKMLQMTSFVLKRKINIKNVN